MVEANSAGDGVVRNFTYGKWRDDKKAEAGYSQELMCIDTKPEFYDNLAAQPIFNNAPND